VSTMSPNMCPSCRRLYARLGLGRTLSAHARLGTPGFARKVAGKRSHSARGTRGPRTLPLRKKDPASPSKGGPMPRKLTAVQFVKRSFRLRVISAFGPLLGVLCSCRNSH
jgi:hypothetical protein